ncbi:MAG: RcnB family protein, partial [Acetobacteraceae bacterium]
QMRRLLLATMAMSLLGPTVVSAQPYHQEPRHNESHGPSHQPSRNESHGPSHRRPGPAAHRWRHGDRFSGPRYQVDWHRHHLRQPPRGYEWVNANGQFLLIAIASGVIADVLLNQ